MVAGRGKRVAYTAGLSRDRAAFLPPVPMPRPPSAIEDVAGQRISSDDLKGKITLLNFWANLVRAVQGGGSLTWSKFKPTYKDRNVAVIGMACSEKSQAGLVRIGAARHQVSLSAGDGR